MEARLLMRAGIILLAMSLLNGFLIGVMPLVALALSAHLVGLMGSAFLIGLGACWPALALRALTSKIGALAAVYGFCGGWLVYLIAAATGTAGMFPIASGAPPGSPFPERVMSGALLTVALALFTVCGIVLQGLREPAARFRMPGTEIGDEG